MILKKLRTYHSPGAHLVSKSGGEKARGIDAGLGAIHGILSFLGEIADFPDQNSVVGSGFHQFQSPQLIRERNVLQSECVLQLLLREE